jgi:hypothetical protein
MNVSSLVPSTCKIDGNPPTGRVGKIKVKSSSSLIFVLICDTKFARCNEVCLYDCLFQGP